MSEIICHCFEVSREEIENAIREKGLKTVEEVGEVMSVLCRAHIAESFFIHFVLYQPISLLS